MNREAELERRIKELEFRHASAQGPRPAQVRAWEVIEDNEDDTYDLQAVYDEDNLQPGATLEDIKPLEADTSLAVGDRGTLVRLTGGELRFFNRRVASGTITNVWRYTRTAPEGTWTISERVGESIYYQIESVRSRMGPSRTYLERKTIIRFGSPILTPCTLMLNMTESVQMAVIPENDTAWELDFTIPLIAITGGFDGEDLDQTSPENLTHQDNPVIAFGGQITSWSGGSGYSAGATEAASEPSGWPSGRRPVLYFPDLTASLYGICFDAPNFVTETNLDAYMAMWRADIYAPELEWADPYKVIILDLPEAE